MCTDPFFSLLVKRDIIRWSVSISINLKTFKHEDRSPNPPCPYTFLYTAMLFLMGYRHSLSLETLIGVAHTYN